MAYEVMKRMAATARRPMQKRRGHERRLLSIGFNRYSLCYWSSGVTARLRG
jgi:hypothetical protein